MKNFAENLTEISDFDSFNKTVLSVINPWRRKYYPDTPVCDGLVWELKIKLSDKKYFLHYEGHHKTPLHYYNLEKFLGGFLRKKMLTSKTRDFLDYLSCCDPIIPVIPAYFR